MSDFVVTRLNSLAELRQCAHEWDALWQRSEVTLPTGRAELVAIWCESFAPSSKFAGLVVHHAGRLVAALPLYEKRLFGLTMSMLPGNYWSPGGDLLLDPEFDAAVLCQSLLVALRRGSEKLLWLDAVPMGTRSWRDFVAALQRERASFLSRHRCTVSKVRIEGDWDDYFARRSANHRRYIRVAEKRASRRGGVHLICHDVIPPERVESLLRECFEIEASGWKGRSHSAVLDSPTAWEFYRRQAAQLAQWGQLSLVTLEHGSKPIAFEYGWRGKDVYYSPKVGYDESLRPLSPGQLLRARLIQKFLADGEVSWIDFMGPTATATAKWATEAYDIERIVVALRGIAAPTLVAAYRHIWPLVRRMVRGPQADPAAADQTDSDAADHVAETNVEHESVATA